VYPCRCTKNGMGYAKHLLMAAAAAAEDGFGGSKLKAAGFLNPPVCCAMSVPPCATL